MQALTLGSFGAGIWRSGPRDQGAPNSAYDLQNYLLNDMGLPYRRGGSAYKSNAGLDGTNPILGVWGGSFNAGQRTVFVSGVNGKLGTLDVDDATPVVLTTFAGSGPPGPVAFAKVGNYLVLGATSFMWAVAGSQKGSSYAIGTVSIATGSRTLTGSGTTWTGNVDPGMILSVTGSNKRYTVQSVDSNTQITLDTAWTEGAAAGAGYTLLRAASFTPSNTLVPVTKPKVASVANRLAYTAGNQVGLSDVNDPFTYSTGNYLAFPGQVLGLARIRDTLLVFTDSGVQVVSGLAYSIVDAAGNPQWRRQVLDADRTLWAHEGLAPWRGVVIAPCLDGVWLMGPNSAPERISDPIQDYYLSLVRTSGNKPGVAATYNGHFMLPVLDGSNNFVDCLVCKLTPTRGARGPAWTRLAGAGAQVTAFAERPSVPPTLLGGALGTSSRVLDLGGYFVPAAAVKNDHDGTTHQATLVTNDLAPSDPQPATVRRARVRYELTDAASDSPTVDFSYQRESDANPTVASSGGVQASSASPGGVSDGSKYSWWDVNAMARALRFRVRTQGPTSNFTLRELELLVEPNQRP